MSLVRVLIFSFCTLMLGGKASALPFIQGRAGGGYAYLGGKDGSKAVSTGVLSGAGRFGYKFDNSNYFLALDVTAFRLFKASALGSNNDGNTLLFAFGHNWDSFNMWLAGGAGELRSHDRESDKAKPYRYYITDAQLGMNWDIYASDEARVQLGCVFGRLAPDAEWRERYGLTTVNSLQFDIGFKLLNW